MNVWNEGDLLMGVWNMEYHKGKPPKANTGSNP